MSVQCAFPRFLPFPEELVAFRLPRLMQHLPEVTIYSPSRHLAWSLTQWCLEILLSGLDNSCPAGLCPVFHFPAAHGKFLGPARRDRGCAAMMEHFASLRHLKGEILTGAGTEARGCFWRRALSHQKLQTLKKKPSCYQELKFWIQI